MQDGQIIENFDHTDGIKLPFQPDHQTLTRILAGNTQFAESKVVGGAMAVIRITTIPTQRIFATIFC